MNEKNRYIVDFEEFFKDPSIENDYLHLGVSSIVCSNLRIALRSLDYDVNDGYVYDTNLAHAVFKFQTDNNHQNCDGIFGPRTRKLLLKNLSENSLFDQIHTKHEFSKTLLICYRELFENYKKSYAVLITNLTNQNLITSMEIQEDINEFKSYLLLCFEKIKELEMLGILNDVN